MDKIKKLINLLEEKYNDRFTYDPLGDLIGMINGMIDSKRVSISCSQDILVISIEPDSQSLIDELMPILKALMDGKDPICSYDLPFGNDEKCVMPTFEWDNLAPEQRIKEIVNGRAFPDIGSVYNIKLFNGKEVSDYIETKEETAELISNAKISGKYPGSIKNPEAFTNISELDLYFAIDALGGALWHHRHLMSHGIVPQTDLSEDQFALEYLVYQTVRFGVAIPEPCYGKTIQATPSYQKWYNFYHNHFHGMSDERWQAFSQAYSAGEDVTPFLPKGSWRDSLDDEPTLK